MAAGPDPSNEVIAFLDIDCFEVQLYQRYNFPHCRGTPCVVADHTGRIVSASHEAKACGISRDIRVERARFLCQNLNVIRKPILWGKPDAKTPRHGSWEVFDALKEFCNNFGSGVVLEHSSSDGFYVNMTNEVETRMQNTHFVEIANNVYIEGHVLSATTAYRFYQKRNDWRILKLLYGAEFVSEMAAYLIGKTELECSAGVSNNKLVAKMACQLNKPAAVTVLPITGFNSVRHRISLSEIPGFGRSSTNGQRVAQILGVQNLEQLSRINWGRLKYLFPGNQELERKLYNGAHGICNEKVVIKSVNNHVTTGKTFHGREAIMDPDLLLANLRFRAGEMMERLQEEKARHNRVANSLQIQFEFKDGKGKATKRNKTFQLSPYQLSLEDIAYKAYQEILNTQPEVRFKPTVTFTKLTLQASWKPLPTPVPAAAAHFVGVISLASLTIGPDTPPRGKVYQLKISLDDTNPTIWRRIQVPENFTFYQLHKAIQDSVGWEWSTHHEFEIGLGASRDGRAQWISVGLPGSSLLDRHQIYPEKETQMTDFMSHVGDKVTYQHGFEKEWPHTVVVEAILEATPGVSYPACIAGARAAPPDYDDDKFGFNELLEAFKNPSEVREFHSKGFYLNYDPAKFKPEEVFFSNVEDSSDEE